MYYAFLFIPPDGFAFANGSQGPFVCNNLLNRKNTT